MRSRAARGEAAPALGSFDDYLVSCWASGSSVWTESRARKYAENVEPQILQNSASCHVVEGAAAKPYDPESYNPSEAGVDLKLLNVGGAHGFTVDEVFGPSDGKPSGMPEGMPDGWPGERPEGMPDGWPGERPEGMPGQRPGE